MNPAVAVGRRIYATVCNDKSPVGFVVNFCKNFSIVFLWLLTFKNAGLIPTEWRPPIHVTILRDADTAIFSGMSGFVYGVIVFVGSYMIARYLVSTKPQLRLMGVEFSKEGVTATAFGSSSTVDRLSDELEIESQLSDSGSDAKDPAQFTPSSFSPSLIMLSSIWIMLNVAYLCINTIVAPLDIIAWLSYVIGHITVPIVTAFYLWLFAPPGACGLFGLSLGMQNLAGVLTHLSFPTAPPWYNHMYGDQPGNYSVPGYAAGLARVDIALGTHVHSQGFHMSPIVFGAFPSLHSAFVCLVFLFVSRYATWGGSNWGWSLTAAKRSEAIVRDCRERSEAFGPSENNSENNSEATEANGAGDEPRFSFRAAARRPRRRSIWLIAPLGTMLTGFFMVWQWWSTMYLDHHYRLDLLGGAIYALTSFLIVLPYLRKAERRYQEDETLTTAGMRLFSGTWFAGFFDPLPRASFHDSNPMEVYSYRPIASRSGTPEV